jgi:hypothetical protein
LINDAMQSRVVQRDVRSVGEAPSHVVGLDPVSDPDALVLRAFLIPLQQLATDALLTNADNNPR